MIRNDLPLILDTHILLWFSEYNPRLLQKSLQNIIDAKDKSSVALSAISVWEIAYLQAKNKIKLDRPFNEWLSDATRGMTIIPICADIAIESASLPDCTHRDPADRFIIATARVLEPVVKL